MKKSSFITMILGTVSGVFFALGMCMALLPEWDAFRPGIVLGCVGLTLGLLTVFVWRRLEHKAPIRLTAKSVLAVLVCVAGALALGIGMCFCMVFSRMVPGIILGLAGIAALLGLIPLVKGIQ